MIMQTASAAQAEGNGKLVLKALAQGTRLITIILKHDLPRTTGLSWSFCPPPWATQSGLLPHDPDILALSRQSLHGFFSSPCPDAQDLARIPSFSPGQGEEKKPMQGLAAQGQDIGIMGQKARQP